MSLIGESIEVYPLVSQWKYSVTDTNLSGTRKYLETEEVLTSGKVNLPNLGDKWDIDNPLLTLKRIDVNYLNDNDSCGREFLCTYDGVPYLQSSQIQSSEEFPISVDVSGQFISYEPKPGAYTWISDNKAVVQPIYKEEGTATIRITRIVGDFDEYMNTVATSVNRLNASNFHGFPVETVMFRGANLTEFRNRNGVKRWRADLVFVFRTVTGQFIDNLDGWNFQVRNDTGEFDVPVLGGAGNQRLYDLIDFAPLFEVSSLGDDEDLFNAFPDQ